MTDLVNIYVKRYDPVDPRLGRHVRHDPRSLQFQVAGQDPSTLQSIRHSSYIPTLDQLKLGSCTGNAATKALSSGICWTPPVQSVLSVTDALADERFAVGVYAEATTLDPYNGSYPPDDTGSDGLSVAKVLKSRGLISGYLHATSLEATLTALAKQAEIVGTEWRGDMFNPDSSGRLHITGDVAGGHEYTLDELDVENRRVWIHNSWGTGWGLNGRAWLSWDDLGTLLAADGDCTIFVPSVDAPPVPEPTPAEALVEATNDWVRKAKILPCNEKVRQALLRWRATQG